MEWTEEQTLHFIKMYRVRSQLWDSTHVQYKIKNVRHDLLTEIAASFGIGKREVERKIKNLQSQFLRERKKELDSKKTGIGAEQTNVSKWFAYQPLMFLADKHKRRRTVDNLNCQEAFHSRDEPKQMETITLPTEPCDSLQHRKIPDELGIMAKSPNSPPKLQAKTKSHDQEEDDCELYSKILAKKLRRLDPDERMTVMYEIDGIFINRLSRNSSVVSTSTAASSCTLYQNRPFSSFSDPVSEEIILKEEDNDSLADY